MDSFTHADVEDLRGHSDEACVSIYLPTHRSATKTKQDTIRLKNLLREAENQLLAARMRRPDVATLLQPAMSLLSDDDFWKYQSDGLAVFLAPGRFHSYRLPVRFDDLVIVANRYQLRPLFPLLTGDGRFLILALSQNEVRLLEATRYGVDELDLAQLPDNLSQALGLEQQEKQLQFHTRATVRGGRRDAMFHGQGPGGEQSKEQLERYFRRIDSALSDLLRSDPMPLVLAGVEYYFPIYRSVSRSPHVVEEGVAGNPENLRSEELHARAWPLVEPLFQREREAAVARYQQLVGTGQTSTNILEVVPATCQGRVEVLFVATDRQQWGTFRPDTLEIVLHDVADAHNEDLLDYAAVRAYSTGAVVYAVPSQQLPEKESIGAIYRY